MSMVDLLLHHGVQPLVVLDGDKMPAKAITEEQRQRCGACVSACCNDQRSRSMCHIHMTGAVPAPQTGSAGGN